MDNNNHDHFLQHSRKEIANDYHHIFELISCDSKFAGLLLTLTHEEAFQAVVEAFNFLHTATDPKEQELKAKLSQKGCMVVFLLQQWLVRFLTKKVMNLMTTEAVILNCKKIPHSYLENYFESQAHFSLIDTLTSYHGGLRESINEK